MANLTITPANVVPGAGATIINTFLAGETITAGMSVYLNTANQKWMKALCNGTALQSGSGTNTGIALNGGSLNQPLSVQTAGPLTIGATVVAGTTYLVSETAGDLCPAADLVTAGDYFSYMIFATTTTVVTVLPVITGAQHV